MKAVIKRFGALLISTLLFSSTLVGCSGCGSKKVDVPNLDDYPEETKKEEVQKAPETGKYIMQNGQTDYKIVLSANAHEYEKFAADELQFFFQDATGVKLSVVTDEQVEYSATSHYFVIGENNTFFSAAGLTIESEERATLQTSGLRVVTKGESLFFYGADPQASVYAVYEWLERELAFDYVIDEFWEIDKDVEEIHLRTYDVTRLPEFNVRSYTQGYITTNNKYKFRMKYSFSVPFINLTLYGKEMAPDGWLEHSYLPKEKYQLAHPGWYSSSTQMCLSGSANGTTFNESEYNALVDELARILCENFALDLVGNRVIFGGFDDNSTCKCETCMAFAEQYGSPTGIFVKLSNDVKTKVDAWMASEEGQPYAREWQLEFLAYAGYRDPPAKVIDGVVTPMIKCIKGVKAYYAPIHTEWTVPMGHELNAEHMQRLEGWLKCSPEEITAWLYGMVYKNYMLPADTIEWSKNLIENMKFYQTANCKYMYIEGATNMNGVASAYESLRLYIISKAMWDLDVDVDACIEKYFRIAYGDASEAMWDIFGEVRMVWYDIYFNKGFKSGPSKEWANSEKKEYWNKDMLIRWIEKYTEAIELLERRGANANQIKMIRAERVSPSYYLLDLYYNEMTQAEIQHYGGYLFTDIEIAGTNRITQSGEETWEMFKTSIGYQG